MEKYGFVYIWYDRKHKRYYVGCRWGNINDGYVCSSKWMKQAYGHRPQDFKRRILKTNIPTRKDTYIEEQRYFDMIKPEELKVRYYNLCIKNNKVWHSYEENIKTIGQKISETKKSKPLSEKFLESRKTVGQAISKAKKGNPLTTAHKDALRGIKKKPHTDEWKEENSKRMKEQWSGDSKRKQAVSEASKRRWEQFRLNKQKEQGQLVN